MGFWPMTTVMANWISQCFAKVKVKNKTKKQKNTAFFANRASPGATPFLGTRSLILLLMLRDGVVIKLHLLACYLTAYYVEKNLF